MILLTVDIIVINLFLFNDDCSLTIGLYKCMIELQRSLHSCSCA